MTSPEYRLAQIIEEGIRANSKVFITVSGKDRYELYGRFIVTPKSNKKSYLVRDTKTGEKQEFTTLKNAMAWCTLVNAKQGINIRRMQSLDLKLYSLSNDIANQRRMLKTATSPESKTIHIIKLQEASLKRKLILMELSEVIKTCKVLQERNFENAKHR